jgi:hypothetical protein
MSPHGSPPGADLILSADGISNAPMAERIANTPVIPTLVSQHAAGAVAEQFGDGADLYAATSASSRNDPRHLVLAATMAAHRPVKI